jgi:hypothetical protein
VEAVEFESERERAGVGFQASYMSCVNLLLWLVHAGALKSLALEGCIMGSLRLTLNVAMASRHIWVGNVAEAVTEQDLYAAFAVYGQLESVRLLAKHRCAFVNFIHEHGTCGSAGRACVCVFLLMNLVCGCVRK